MIKFYKKGPLGMVKADGGMSDPEASEVRMTVKEYKKLLSDVSRAEKDAENARENASDIISDIKEKALEEIERAKRQAAADANRRADDAMITARRSAQEAAGLREDLEEAQKTIENEKFLNSNLQRIMRERSNQARGITPKKAHDGYLVLKSRQWVETYPIEIWDTEDHQVRYAANRKLAMKKGYLTIEKRSDIVCKSTLQTPYDASIPLDLIQGRIMGEDLWNKGILMELGCNSMCGTAVTGKYMPSEESRNKNELYRWIFEANYKSGLWELDIFTTKPLTVPEHRRPPQRVNGKKDPSTIKMTRKKKREEAAREAEDFFYDGIFD